MRSIAIAFVAASFAHGQAQAQAVSCGFAESATVSSAVLIDGRRDPVSALLGVHEIQAGSELVLLFRGFRRIEGVIDADTYWKLSTAIRESVGESTVTMDTSKITARFSTGGSSWVHKGYGYVSASGAGLLRLRRVSTDSMAGDIDMEFIARRVEDPSETSRYRIRGTYQAGRLDRRELTPWQGSKVGNDERAVDAAARPSPAERSLNEWQSKCDVTVIKLD